MNRSMDVSGWRGGRQKKSKKKGNGVKKSEKGQALTQAQTSEVVWPY